MGTWRLVIYLERKKKKETMSQQRWKCVGTYRFGLRGAACLHVFKIFWTLYFPLQYDRVQQHWLKICGNFFIQFSSVTHLCLTLRNPINCSTPGLPVHHQLQEFTQTHVHRVGDAIQPPHLLSSPSPPAPNPSQHQGLFQWVNSLHEVAKVLKFQL